MVNPQSNEESQGLREPAHPGDPGLLTWPMVSRLVRRNFWIILGSSVALSVLTLLILVLFRPPRYEAVATLAIAPQPFGTELTAVATSADDYQRLLESNAVLVDTAKHLRTDGVFEDDQPLRLGRDLRANVVVSPPGDGTLLPSLIEAVAEASTPEIAATVANTWCEVLIAHSHRLYEHTVDPLIRMIEARYEEEHQRLLELTAEETRLAEELQARLDALSLSWDRKVVETNNGIEDLIVAFHAETRRRMEDFAIEAGLEPAVGRAGEGSGASCPPQPSSEVESRLLRILALRIRLAQTPRFLILKKAVTDDALWHTLALGRNETVSVRPLVDRKLATEEPNPVYDQLSLRLSELEADPDSFSPEDWRRIQGFTAGLERIQAERTAELAKMLSDRALRIEDLERQRSRGVQTLHRERKSLLDRIAADLGLQRSLVTKLAEDRSKAGLAEGEQAMGRVRLAAAASPPGAPIPRDTSFMVMVAAFVGGLIGLVVALLRGMVT